MILTTLERCGGNLTRTAEVLGISRQTMYNKVKKGHRTEFIIEDVDFVIGPFSKSFGTVGGYCVSNHPKFEIMRLVCRPYVFTASLPPSDTVSG